MSVSKDLLESKQAFHRAVAIMEEVYQSVRARDSFPIAKVEMAMDALVQNLEISDALLVPFLNAGGHPVSPAKEVVSVCILSVKIGMQLHYSPDELPKLGLAALLHDIGITRIPKRALERAGSSVGEQAALKRLPEEGAQLIRGLGSSYARLAEVVLQVHERTDGSGYPMGLREEKIHEHAQIVGLADVYQSLVHYPPLRPHVWPPPALKEILQRERTRFPDRLLKALIQVLAALPVGGFVRLNSGEIGQVVAKNENFPLRPVVAILARRGKRLPGPKLIDLRQNPLLHVQQLVTEEMLEAEIEGVEP